MKTKPKTNDRSTKWKQTIALFAVGCQRRIELSCLVFENHHLPVLDGKTVPLDANCMFTGGEVEVNRRVVFCGLAIHYDFGPLGIRMHYHTPVASHRRRGDRRVFLHFL